MQGRRISRRLVISLSTMIVAVGAGIVLSQLGSTADAPARSDVAGARIAPSLRATHSERAADWYRVGRRRIAESEGVVPGRPTVAQALVFFDALQNGAAPHTAAPSGPTVAQALVFFDALREGSPHAQVRNGPTVAQVLVFFHVLLSEAPHDAAPAAPAPRMAAAPPPPPAPIAPAVPQPTATLVPPPPPPPPLAPVGASADVWTDAAFTQAVWVGANERRSQAGMPPVEFEPRLATAAADYAALMSATDWFSHTGPDGSSFVDRITAAGFPFTSQLGEILAMGSDGWPPSAVVQAWIDSPAHREQMLNPSYRLAGVGCAFTNDGGTLMVRCAMEFAQ